MWPRHCDEPATNNADMTERKGSTSGRRSAFKHDSPATKEQHNNKQIGAAGRWQERGGVKNLFLGRVFSLEVRCERARWRGGVGGGGEGVVGKDSITKVNDHDKP